MTSNSTIRYADLFCGIGGMRIGLEQACRELGLESRCVLSCDKKKSAKAAYEENFGEIPDGDITRIDASGIEDFDVLLGGFPCQPFSRAGMRRGLSDARGTMFFEIKRIAEAKHPALIILENVPDIMTYDGGYTMHVITDSLSSIGYDTTYGVLNGTELGLPQNRTRTIIVGALRTCENGAGCRRQLTMDDVRRKLESMQIRKSTMGSIIDDNALPLNDDFIRHVLKSRKASSLAGYVISDKRRGDRTLHSWDIELHGGVTDDEKRLLELILSEHRKRKYARELGVRWRDGMPLNMDQLCNATGMGESALRPMLDDLTGKGYLLMRHPYKDGCLEEREDLPIGWKLVTSRVSFEINRFLGPDDICATLTATDASHIGVISSDGESVHRLSIREGLRLFGFPESYSLSSVSESNAYDLIGNTVCVPMIKIVCEEALKRI